MALGRWEIRAWDRPVQTTTKNREHAFALAGVRAMNSGKTQRVTNTATGEQWSVYFGPSSAQIKRLADVAPTGSAA